MADAELDSALESAHLPALLAALVHMTGDPGWIRPEWTPTYVPLSRGETGLSEEVQAEVRALAKAAIKPYLAGGSPKMPSPDTPTLRRMMDFVGGTPIPETYADFLIDELAISGVSSKDPQFEQPQLKAAARQQLIVKERRYVDGSGLKERSPAAALDPVDVGSIAASHPKLKPAGDLPGAVHQGDGLVRSRLEHLELQGHQLQGMQNIVIRLIVFLEKRIVRAKSNPPLATAEQVQKPPGSIGQRHQDAVEFR